MKSNIWKVTKWEFNRFFKWMDLLKGLAFMLVFGFIGGLVVTWVTWESVSKPNVAVHDYGVFNIEDFQEGPAGFTDHTATDLQELITMLEEGEIDGILTLSSADQAEIRLRSERAWTMELRQFLDELRTRHKLQDYAIDPEQYASLTAGISLQKHFDQEPGSSIDKVVAGVAIFLVIMAVFMSFSYQFTAITAEKQQRMTELVVSAISPRTWIDGKILGITGVGLIYVIFYGGMGLLTAAVLVWLGAPIANVFAAVNPFFLIFFIVLALLGTLMWNSFFAGIAATIDDPNTSQRTGFMILPIYPVFLAFFALVNPDTIAMKILGIFPITSYAVLPARMVMTQVGWWEPWLALVLLAATAWLFRVAAGKIFAVGMMTYGKEPGIGELWSHFRKA